MSNVFPHRPRTNHERRMANSASRFRTKPSQNPDHHLPTQTYTLCHIGKSAVPKSCTSGLAGVHHLLMEYYLFFLKVMTRESLSLEEYMKRTPSFRRHLTIKKGTLIIKFKRPRRPPSDGMLINEEQIYCGEQIAYCDCFCFEVVLPTGATAAKLNEPEVCYAYFRQASDCRRAIPESSLFPLDRELSSWFLRHRQYPRPPIVACLLGPSRVCNSLFCHIFVAGSVDLGLQFVKNVVNYTYGLKDDYINSTADMKYRNYTSASSYSNHDQTEMSASNQSTINVPQRAFQKRVTRKSSRSQSPYTRRPHHATSSAKNGRSIQHGPGMATIQPSGSLNLDSMDEFEAGNNSETTDSMNNYHGAVASNKMLSKLQLLGNSKWLTSSTPALIISPISDEDFEPLRQRLLQFQLAQEASCVQHAKRARSHRMHRDQHDSQRRTQSSDRHSEVAAQCRCASCVMRSRELNLSSGFHEERSSTIFRAPKHFYANKSEEYLNQELL